MSAALTLDEKTHTYRLGNRRLHAVGSIINDLKPKFDSEKWSQHIAKKEGKTKAQVLAQWAKKRDDANDRGHALHAQINTHLAGKPVYEKDATESFVTWYAWWSNAKTPMLKVETELKICDEELGIAGTLDALFLSSITKQLHVFDWKQNEKFREVNDYNERLLTPFEDLHNCEYVTYSMQVCLYTVILKRQGKNCGRGWILHLTPEKATPYRAMDLEERMLDYVKGLKL